MTQAISFQRTQMYHQDALQLEQNQRAGSNQNPNWCQTAAKVVFVIGGLIALASFMVLPVAVAIFATVTLGVLGLAVKACMGRSSPLPSHTHQHSHHSCPSPEIPWYKKAITPYYALFNPHPSAPRSNVPIGGQNPRPPAPRSDVPVAPSGVNPLRQVPISLPPGRGTHVGLGGGHNPPGGPGASGHVGLGGGHNPPGGPGASGHVGLGGGHNPSGGPGAPGHVGVGRGHFLPSH